MFDKKNVAKILEEDLKDAKLSCIDFEDEAVKKRAFINVLGARLAMKIFFSRKIEANNLYSLYTIHNVLEELDVADIYFGGTKIDVRLVFNKEEIFIPKSHSKYGLEPDIYVVLTLKEDFSSVEFLGYFEPKELDKNNQNDEFYFFDHENLQNPNDFKKFLGSFVPENNFELSEENSEMLEGMFLSLVDKEITGSDKKFLFKKLSSSIDLREKLVEFENFELISKELGKNGDLFQDNVLDIVGAQQLFNEEDELAALAEEHLEQDNVGEIVLDENFELDEKDSEDNEEEEEEEGEKQKDGKILENSVKALTAGLELGTVLAAGAVAGGAIAASAAGSAAAAAAETQGEIIKGSAEVLSSGIDLGKELVKKGFEAEKDELEFMTEDFDQELPEFDLPNDEEFDSEKEEAETEAEAVPEIDFETQDEISAESDFFSVDELPDFESDDEIKIETEEDEMPFEFETAKDEEEDDLAQFAEIEDSYAGEESFKEEVLPTFETEIEPLEAEHDALFEELPELEVFESDHLESDPFSSESFDTESIKDTNETEGYAEEKTGEEEETKTIEDDDFNFEVLKDDNDEDLFSDETSEETEHNEELLSFDSIGEGAHLDEFENEEELEAKIREIEAMEEMADVQESDDLAGNSSDEFISQVDDFLKEVELTDEQKELIENTLSEEILETPSEQVYESPEYETAQAEEIPEPIFDESLLEDKETQNSSGEDKDLLNVLFEQEALDENISDIDFEQERIPVQPNKNKKMIIAASIASVVLVSAVIGSGIMHNKPSASETANSLASAPIAADAPVSAQTGDSMNMDMSQQNPLQDIQQDMPGENQQMEPADMGKSVSNAFLSEPVSANISKVAWEVPEDLAYNDSFRKYLQIAGKNLKLNLQNNLLLATEMAYSNKVVVDLNIDRSGNLTGENVVITSGSKQIDKIVLQSVKETLKYLKMPSSELSGQSAVATLIINF